VEPIAPTDSDGSINRHDGSGRNAHQGIVKAYELDFLNIVQGRLLAAREAGLGQGLGLGLGGLGLADFLVALFLSLGHGSLLGAGERGTSGTHVQPGCRVYRRTKAGDIRKWVRMVVPRRARAIAESRPVGYLVDMKPADALDANRSELRRLVARHGVLRPRIFGSVLKQADTETSDLDLLVDPSDSTTLLSLAALQIEAEALLGVRVSVLTPDALPRQFRAEVLAEARPL